MKYRYKLQREKDGSEIECYDCHTFVPVHEFKSGLSSTFLCKICANMTGFPDGNLTRMQFAQGLHTLFSMISKELKNETK